jgi:ferritin-like metal-binding protein YciE
MSAPEDLADVYADELKDLWSANDQMQAVVKDLAAKASDKTLKGLLEKSLKGLAEHTDAVKALIVANGEEVTKEHCKGMEGLVKEARKHAIDEKIEDGDVRDVVIVAQYQRMSHYGLAGFGTAAAYAKALGRKDDEKQLKAIVESIYGADEFASRLAEQSVNLAAK